MEGCRGGNSAEEGRLRDHTCVIPAGENMENPDADLSHQHPGVALLLAFLVQIAVMGWMSSFFFFLMAINQL